MEANVDKLDTAKIEENFKDLHDYLDLISNNSDKMSELFKTPGK